MRKILVILILAALLNAGVSNVLYTNAIYIPDSDVCENRDGRQLIIRTFILAPGDDPETLVEEPFEREGYSYSLASIVKEEKPFENRVIHNETVTVETASNDLAEILGALDATMQYDDGEYTGALALDHTTLNTEATGFSTKHYTISDVKTYENLDRNDPSFIPKTTVKNGATLTLQNVEWSAQSTAISGSDLVVAQYMATARYSAGASYRDADGYITTAVYSGEVVSSGISSILYTVTYVGHPVPAPVPEPVPEPEPEPEPVTEPEKPPLAWLKICAGAAILLASVIAVYILLRSNTKIYTMEPGNEEYGLIGKQRLKHRDMTIDLRACDRYPESTAVIEINRQTARRLFGRAVKVQRLDDVIPHRIEQCGNTSYWFKIPTYESEEPQ